MTIDVLKKRGAWLETIGRDFETLPDILIVEGIPVGVQSLHHYTSLRTLFKILENDYLWASGTRYSNDSTEEALSENALFQDEVYPSDNFITCFCGKDDLLSQWRGYCYNGGASIEFDLKRPHEFSILHADYDSSGKFELVQNVPHKVRYVDKTELMSSESLLAKQIADDSRGKKYSPWVAGDIIPYLKDSAFHEENEWRLLFGNVNGSLSKCIRFRELQDGSKIPYIVIKVGDIGKRSSGCRFDPKKYTVEELDCMWENGIRKITIPQGHDQESVYYALEKEVMRYNNTHRKEYRKIIIACDGHLPIKRITVAPTYARERIAEKIKRYCWSIYWLRNVEVVSSSIPYIPPSE